MPNSPSRNAVNCEPVSPPPLRSTTGWIEVGISRVIRNEIGRVEERDDAEHRGVGGAALLVLDRRAQDEVRDDEQRHDEVRGQPRLPNAHQTPHSKRVQRSPVISVSMTNSSVTSMAMRDLVSYLGSLRIRKRSA